jgi:hypothetical protein
MSRPPRKAPPSQPRKLVFGAAAGRGPEDFYVVGYCRELDELELATNPDHEEFTWIYHFAGTQRQLVTRLSQRIDDLWLAPSGVVYAVGRPRGVLQIRGLSCTEVSIENVPGTFAGIWGPDEDHVLCVGHHDSFLLYREFGRWLNVPLPPKTGGLWDVGGINEHDVYAVSDEGEIVHFDGQQLVKLDSPTTRWLTAVAPMPDDRVCIGGYGGTLLYGNRRGWRFVDTGTDEPLLSLAPHRAGVCFLTQDAVWWFDGVSAPHLLLRQGGRWINALGGSIMIVDGESAWLSDGVNLTQLDTTV